MKAKLKGANGFVRFLLNHGEKIGIAAILLVAGMLVYSSFGRPIVDDTKQPDKLSAAASNATNHVQQMSWEAFPKEERTDFATFDSQAEGKYITPVDPSQYPVKSPWDDPVIPPVKQRQDPVLVAAIDLEVQPGSGLWMAADPDVILEKMRAAAADAAKLRREAEEAAARAADEAEGGRGRGRGRDGGMGMEGGRGGMGMGGDMGGMKTKDGAIVVPPAGGAQMQGFEDIREMSWVTVLAKIPIKQQFQMYEDALATARNFSVAADSPQYLGYVIERAEVTEEGTGKFVPIQTMTAKKLTDKMATWPPTQSMDMGNPKYKHPLLTHPLPPMVMREWGNEITHTDLPIPTPEDLAREAEEAAQQPLIQEDDAGAADDPFGSAAKRTMQQGGMYARGEMGMGGRPSMGMEGRGGMGMGRPPAMGMGGMRGEGGMGMGMGGMGMGGRGSDGAIQLEEYVWDGVTKNVLFRFFDDTVKPGHRYRYRVQLVVKDVNADQPPKFLDPTVTARQTKDPRRFRMSEWSEPSPVAVVPDPGLLFVAQTKDVATFEPEARLIVKSVDSVNAAEIAHNDWYRRGSVLNFAKQAQVIWSSLYKVSAEEPTDSPTFKFLTGLTLVDVEGGDQMTKNRKLLAPARMLVMDSSGRLMMQNELDQSKAIRSFDYIMQQSADADRRAREGAEDRGGRGGGGRRGGF